MVTVREAAVDQRPDVNFSSKDEGYQIPKNNNSLINQEIIIYVYKYAEYLVRWDQQDGQGLTTETRIQLGQPAKS